MPRGGKREGAGPKPLPDGHRKATMAFAVSPDDELWLRAQADDRGISLSAVIALALACLRKHQQELPK
jgi:hypothetical protein